MEISGRRKYSMALPWHFHNISTALIWPKKYKLVFLAVLVERVSVFSMQDFYFILFVLDVVDQATVHTGGDSRVRVCDCDFWR